MERAFPRPRDETDFERVELHKPTEVNEAVYSVTLESGPSAFICGWIVFFVLVRVNSCPFAV